MNFYVQSWNDHFNELNLPSEYRKPLEEIVTAISDVDGYIRLLRVCLRTGQPLPPDLARQLTEKYEHIHRVTGREFAAIKSKLIAVSHASAAGRYSGECAGALALAYAYELSRYAAHCIAPVLISAATEDGQRQRLFAVISDAPVISVPEWQRLLAEIGSEAVRAVLAERPITQSTGGNRTSKQRKRTVYQHGLTPRQAEAIEQWAKHNSIKLVAAAMKVKHPVVIELLDRANAKLPADARIEFKKRGKGPKPKTQAIPADHRGQAIM